MTVDDPCDDWPIMLVPGTAAHAATQLIKTFFPSSIADALKSIEAAQFAKGGIFTAQPNTMHKPISVFGEAGPEAIMPRREIACHYEENSPYHISLGEFKIETIKMTEEAIVQRVTLEIKPYNGPRVIKGTIER